MEMGKRTQAWDVRFIADKVHMHPKRPNKPGVEGGVCRKLEGELRCKWKVLRCSNWFVRDHRLPEDIAEATIR